MIQSIHSFIYLSIYLSIKSFILLYNYLFIKLIIFLIHMWINMINLLNVLLIYLFTMLKKIRDLFNSEQEMKMEKEKISSEIIIKL